MSEYPPPGNVALVVCYELLSHFLVTVESLRGQGWVPPWLLDLAWLSPYCLRRYAFSF